MSERPADAARHWWNSQFGRTKRDISAPRDFDIVRVIRKGRRRGVKFLDEGHTIFQSLEDFYEVVHVGLCSGRSK